MSTAGSTSIAEAGRHAHGFEASRKAIWAIGAVSANEIAPTSGNVKLDWPHRAQVGSRGDRNT